MVEYGMSNQQALAAATSVAAKVLGASDLGTVRAGNVGFVILNGDPLQDIANLRRVYSVVRESEERDW
jgi:imidazolonepropionase-like amidohydrolase